jgi:phosphoribosylamine--glycine ligase
MFILVIDPDFLSLDWCLRCVAYGHTVKVYSKGSRSSHIGEGLVDKVDKWNPYMGIADLIMVADNLMFMDEVDEYIKKGYPIFGPGKRAAKLEIDRMHGQELIEAISDANIPSVEFSNYDDAINYVKQNPGRYCSKPSSEVSDKTLTYIAKDEADLIGFLSKRKAQGKKADPFILQEFKKGTEFAVTGIFGPGGWSKIWFEGFEHKKLMADELGVATGETGTVVYATEESKLADILMKPLADELHKIQYCGFLDVNCMVDEKNGTPWFMEFTARAGYPMWSIITSLITNEDPAQWFLDCVKGKDTLEAQVGKVATGVVIFNSDFPWNKKEEESYLDFPIFIDDIDVEHLHPAEVKLTKTCKMVDGELDENCYEWGTAGTFLVVCTGVGDSVSESKDKAYKIVKQVKVGNDSGYRLDIGNKCEKFLKELHKFGYAKKLKF